jgi:hypothetical protein
MWKRPASDAAWITLGMIVALAPALFADAATPEPAVTRVALLRGGVRSSVVVDLQDAAGRATEVLSLDDRSFSVEIGPVRRRVVAQNLEAAPSSPLVREVKVRGIPQTGNAILVRVEVKARAPVSGRVRTAGRRVYLDLQPIPAPAGAPGWEDDLLRRASALALRPDVMGLVGLRTELVQHRSVTGDQAPPGHDRDDRVLAQLDQYLDQARQRQLIIDGRLLGQPRRMPR